MKIIITGRKCSPRESFKEHAEVKLQKVERFFGDSAEAKITVSAEKSGMRSELTVSSRGMIFRAEEVAATMNEAFDKSVDAIIRQIRKNKTRLEKRLRSGSLDDALQVAGKVEEEVDYDIVRTKSVALKPQSVEEAVLQMNLLGHQFYMFRNAESGEVNVVYKRNDGGYGVLVPDGE